MRSHAAQQSPAAYDRINLTRAGLRTRLEDGSYRYRLHASESTLGLVEADLIFGFDVLDARRYGFDAAATAADNSAALQLAIDVAEEIGGGEVRLPEIACDFAGGVELKSYVTIRGAGPFATVLTCTAAGAHGFQAAAALPGVMLSDLQLEGTGAANASEDGVHIVGGASGGFPKLVLRNLLVRSWGNVGIYVENGFDAAIENCNASSNKSHGFHLISCFSVSGGKNVAWQNEGHGFLIQSAAGSLFSGTAQENNLNGWRIESAQGCTFATYVEQNGHAGSAATTAQVLMTQRAGGYSVSSGNKLNVFALGGKGSTSPTLESGYGVYLDFAEDNEVNGSVGGHLTNDVLLTSNSSRNDLRTLKFLTGLAGGDTTIPVANNATNGTNLIPVKVRATAADAGTGNVGAGEDDLKSYSLPAGAMFMNGQALEIIVWGTTANNTNSKRIRVYFGATVVWDSGAVAAQARDWLVRVLITRLSGTSQQAIADGNFAADTTARPDFTAPAETLSGAVTIKVTGEGVADNDILQRGYIVRGL